jgi:Ca2+/Na+ antiporter
MALAAASSHQWHDASLWSDTDFEQFATAHRRLAYEDECSMSAVCQVFGDDCKSQFDMFGGEVLMALIVVYTFKILGTICDGHLTAIVGRIVEKLGVPEDVAGATFMAMSSSAPEVILTIVSTFLVESSSGAACVVGSALFNLQIIVGVLPLVSTTGPLKINWFVAYRDCIYYFFSLIELGIFCWDGKITWWESLIMILTYGTYVLFFIFYNQKWMEFYGLHLENDIQGTREFTDGQPIRYPELCRKLTKEKLSEKELQTRWTNLKRVDWMSEEELDDFFKYRMLKYFDIEENREPGSEPSPSAEVIGLDSVVLFNGVHVPASQIGAKLPDLGVEKRSASDDPHRMETKGKISTLEMQVKDVDQRIRKYKASTAFAAVAAQTLDKRKAAMVESLKALKGEIGELEEEN